MVEKTTRIIIKYNYNQDKIENGFLQDGKQNDK